MIADLHIHSRFSRACSKNIDAANLEKWAKVKGLDLLGTGDFTHPEWFAEMSKLEETGGVLRSSSGFPFLWQSELSLMYTQDGKGRRIHFVMLAPSKDVVIQITDFLKSKGRIDYDGRPIFGFSAIELVENLMSISKDIEIIPAHIWTSWFGILGSKTGFDNFEECFKDQVKNIHSFETGLSSDPLMNGRCSFLDKFSTLSFSDTHSFWPWRIGREATIFDCSMNYKEIINCIRSNTKISTIEVKPEYGKYHWDGHRNCGVSLDPAESRKLKGICPKCGKGLTIGVEYRVDELADRSESVHKDFKHLIPLHELIAFSLGMKAMTSKKVWGVYNQFIDKFKSEFNILLDVPKEEFKSFDEKLVDLIFKNREGKIKVRPGSDGVYGKIISDNENIKQKSNIKKKAQSQLVEF